MVTGYEANYYRQIDILTQAVRSIAENTNRIANCLEAAELRARKKEEGLLRPVYSDEVLDQVLPAIEAIHRGFASMEEAERAQREGG